MSKFNCTVKIPVKDLDYTSGRGLVDYLFKYDWHCWQIEKDNDTGKQWIRVFFN